jgi:hypothetical protein
MLADRKPATGVRHHGQVLHSGASCLSQLVQWPRPSEAPSHGQQTMSFASAREHAGQRGPLTVSTCVARSTSS